MDVLWNSCFQACSRLKLFLKSGAMLRWQCSHTFIVPDNGKMKYKVYNIDWDMCFSVWLSFFLFHSLAHYVEAATNRLGFQSPKLSSNQAEMPRTRFVTNLVRLLQGLLILHKSYNIYYFTLLCNNFFLHQYHRGQGFESHLCPGFARSSKNCDFSCAISRSSLSCE